MKSLSRWLLCLALLVFASGIATTEEDPRQPDAESETKTEAEPKAEADSAEPKVWEWVFFYYMAYDNNLEHCGRPILNMLKEGITSEDVAVVTYADFRDRDGMLRFEQFKGTEKSTRLETEASAHESTVKEALDWTRDNYRAKRYSVIFLNHGSRLSEMSHDEYPGVRNGQNWLHAVKVADVIAEWRRSLDGGELELMFIQQCGKGTIENYHAFRHTSPFVMASQTIVGAPNYYYTDMMKAVCEEPDIDGKALAALIKKHETNNMYVTYTTVCSKALGDTIERVNAVIKPLLELEEFKRPTVLPEPRGAMPTLEPGQATMCFQPSRDEFFVDGLALLKALYAANKLDEAPLKEFSKWVQESLIVEHRVSPLRTRQASTWCGFSVYVPATRAAMDRYRKDYPIYKESRLDELMDKLTR